MLSLVQDRADERLQKWSEAALEQPHELSTEPTYTVSERKLLRLTAPPPPADGKRFHLFVSDHNHRALELLDEVRVAFGERSVRQRVQVRGGALCALRRRRPRAARRAMVLRRGVREGGATCAPRRRTRARDGRVTQAEGTSQSTGCG